MNELGGVDAGNKHGEVTPLLIDAYTYAQVLFIMGYLPCKKFYKVWYFSK